MTSTFMQTEVSQQRQHLSMIQIDEIEAIGVIAHMSKQIQKKKSMGRVDLLSV
jgi:hypothetical protein